MKNDYIKLERAWLEAYKAWLELDGVLKQIYPMPRRPKYLDGKILIQKEDKLTECKSSKCKFSNPFHEDECDE